MTFDAEVRTSLRAITVEAKSTKTAVDQTNTSLRQTSATLTTVAQKHREVSVAAQQSAASTGSLATKVGQVGQAAVAAGGAGGGLVTRLGGLAAINPMALGVGVAIGFVTSKITEAIQEASEFNDLLERTGKLAGEIRKGVDSAGRAAQDSADVQGMRSRMFDDIGGGALFDVPADQAAAAMEAARQAVQVGKAKSTDEAIQRMIKGGAFERGRGALTGGGGPAGVDALAVLGAGLDITPEEFQRRRREMAGSPGGQALNAADARQYRQRDQAERQQQALLEDAAGINAAPRLDPMRAGLAGNPEAAKTLAETNAKLAEMTAELRKLTSPGWHGPIDYFRKVRLEDRISDLQAQHALMIQDVTAGYR